MIGTIVTLRFPNGMDRSAVLRVAEGTKGMFDGMPGLHSKVYTLDAENGEAVNVYLWDSEEAARGFFSDDVRKLIVDSYGVEPMIRHVEVAAVIENAPAAVG